MSPTLAAVLKCDRTIVAFGLAGVATLSWTYLIYMNWGMRHMDVGVDMVMMPAMQHWTAWDLVLVFVMWAVMMVAMMVPTGGRIRTSVRRNLSDPFGICEAVSKNSTW